MKKLSILTFAIVVCLIGMTTLRAVSPGEDDSRARRNTAKKKSGKTAQVGFAPIIVNGRTLNGPNSSAEDRDGRLMIPMATLARALGDTITIGPAGEQTVTIKRLTGTIALFDVKKGQILENGATVLSISNTRSIVFSPYVEQLMLPIEIAAALFDAAMRYDSVKNAVIVTRGVTGVVTKQKKQRLPAELYQAEYEYNFSRYRSTVSSYLSLNAVGRLGDGRFNLRTNFSGPSQLNFGRQNFTFDLERPNGQFYSVGDIGTGSGMQLMTANIRGATVTVPVGEDYTVTAFGGRSTSGVQTRADLAGVTAPARASFDTNVYGGYVTTTLDDIGDLNPIRFSAGAMRFDGTGRSGTLGSASANYSGSLLQLQADLGFGTFRGKTADDRTIDGPGMALDVAGTFKATSDLSFQGRYANIGANFLSPQQGLRDPISLVSGGVSWSPLNWLTSSVTASTASRPNVTGSNESYVSTSFVVSPRAGRPQFYVSHTQSSSQANSNGQFTLVNYSQSFRRMRVFANATRVKSIGTASSTAQFGSNVSINEKNSLEVSQGVSTGKNANGLAEWRTDRWLNGRLGMTAGMGYNYSQSTGVRTYQKVTGSLSLPRGTSVQASYLRSPDGPTLLVQVRGTLFRRRDAGSYMYAAQGDVNDYARVSGRVYQDENANGKYEAGVDKPQNSVKVRIDGGRFAETDVNGLFSFEAVTPGGHTFFVDLLSIRADLTMIDGGTRELVLEGGRHTQFDFRLVRTGRLHGRVWLDANENGKFDEGEQPLGDVRIVTASGRDTLTDADGFYTIGDLAPGEHVILIDEKTLPEKTVVGSKPLSLQVFPGRETNDADLPVTNLPAEVKVFGNPSKP